MLLTDKLHNKRIILASQSPRRQELIKELGLDFVVKIKEVEERYESHLQRQEITNYLAKLKASVFTNLTDNEIVITSDTIVWLEEKPLGKPKDRAHAIEMLQQLSGKMHEVYTSICLTSNQKQVIDYQITKVFFKELSLEEIIYYIDTYKPFDKAGSYGIQEWIGYIGIEKIEGSYPNVMGLPTNLLYKMLSDF